MAPATKKQKTDSEKFPCFSCDTDRTSKQFPEYNPGPDCDHLINTCKTCLKKWVESNVEIANFALGREEGSVFGVKCPHPQCEGIMRNVNVEIAATKKVYERFDELERKHIGDTQPDWRWCLNPACRAGQVHKPKKPESKVAEGPSPKRQKRKGFFKKAEPEPKPVEETDICTCHECGRIACVTCDRPWHDGETCAEYQTRIKDRVEEEDQALKEIQKVTKSCPNCNKKIQKNGGCPAMHCTQCKVVFCWTCESIFAPNGCKCTRR